MYFMLFMNARGFNARDNTTKAINASLNLAVKTLLNNESFKHNLEKETGRIRTK